MDAALHIMAYPGLNHNSHLGMDLTYPDINDDQFPVLEWKEFNGGIKEPIPPNAPKPLVKSVHICMFVDSNHAGENPIHSHSSPQSIYQQGPHGLAL